MRDCVGPRRNQKLVVLRDDSGPCPARLQGQWWKPDCCIVTWSALITGMADLGGHATGVQPYLAGTEWKGQGSRRHALSATLTDTWLEPDLEPLLWSTVHVFHRMVRQRSQKEQDGREICSVELEHLVAEGLTLSLWRPRSGSLVSCSTLTASMIDSRDFLNARRRGRNQPVGADWLQDRVQTRPEPPWQGCPVPAQRRPAESPACRRHGCSPDRAFRITWPTRRNRWVSRSGGSTRRLVHDLWRLFLGR